MNVLLDDNQHAKICDFGSAFVNECHCPAGSPEDVLDLVTQIYVSPEIWMIDEGARTTKESDVWALGCVILEVSPTLNAKRGTKIFEGQIQTGLKPYEGYNHWVQMKKVIDGEQPATKSQLQAKSDQNSIAVMEVMFDCWEFDPVNRPDASSILQRLNEAVVDE
jgi:serine/threonine protein kinase